MYVNSEMQGKRNVFSSLFAVPCNTSQATAMRVVITQQHQSAFVLLSEKDASSQLPPLVNRVWSSAEIDTKI